MHDLPINIRAPRARRPRPVGSGRPRVAHQRSGQPGGLLVVPRSVGKVQRSQMLAFRRAPHFFVLVGRPRQHPGLNKFPASRLVSSEARQLWSEMERARKHKLYEQTLQTPYPTYGHVESLANPYDVGNARVGCRTPNTERISVACYYILANHSYWGTNKESQS